MIFSNGQLIGGPTEFIQWAETNHNYELFRPMTLYQTFAEQQYKEHMNSHSVSIIMLCVHLGHALQQLANNHDWYS